MISSVISRSDLNAKRALFISTDKVAVYHWSKGDLADAYLFDTDDEGRENFSRYLKETSKAPFFVIVDVFEEEYRQDTIPHVFGPDRLSIIERKVSRLFRDTPYYFHQVIGREEEGRRDDQILLTAITNPDTVKPWIDMLEEEKVPLVGIYSLPLFTESILKNIEEEPSKHKLIVSIQSISGLRQTYFHNDKFRISRLVQMPRYGSTPYGPYIRDEVEKIRRYLNSLRLISADESLQIYFLLTGDLLKELKEEYSGQGYEGYIFCDLNDLLEKAGSEVTIKTPFSDRYFVQQVLKTKPANFYASKQEKRYFSMRRLRYSMVAASILLLLGGVIWGGINFMDGLGYKQDSLAAQKKAQFYTTLYDLAKQRLPKTPVEPGDLKVAIDLTDKLSAHKTSPLDTLQTVSRSLERYPSIQLLKLSWMASTDPNVNLEKGSVSKPTTPQIIGASSTQLTTAPGFDSYHVAKLEGRIEPFDGNYRQAIDLINRFAESLRQKNNIHDINIISLPLDVSSEASLQGSAQQRVGRADFSMRIVVGLKHGI